MCDKSVEPTSDAGVSTSLRNPATPTKNASPRKLPVPRPSPTKNLCEACRLNEVTIFKSLSTSDNDISSFDNLSLNIKTSIYDLEMEIKNIGEKVRVIEEEIFSHRGIITELENGLSELANKLNKVFSQKLPSNDLLPHNDNGNHESLRTSSSNTKIIKSSPELTYTHFPRIEPNTSSPTLRNKTKVLSRKHFTSNSHTYKSHRNHRPSILIMGDSNTKYVNLPHANYHKIPTYTIEDIDPAKCIGYAKLWLHVGINNLKSVRCDGLDDVHKSFNLFMHKVDQIGKLSPSTTVIISPILPTGIKALNDRARAFNCLLFATKRWWHELNFSIFATGNNMLHNYYRCFGNPRDKIHLGFNGIRELEHLIVRQNFPRWQ